MTVEPLAGGAGHAATAVLPRARVSRRRGLGDLLENERILSYLLLAPTAIILGVFIAYPFGRGV